MTVPRPVIAGVPFFGTRNCTQRQYLLRPDPDSVNAYIYCLAVSAQKYGVSILAFVQMSNHLHYVGLDDQGVAPAFYEHFHKLLAKCINAQRGRWENVFASEQTNIVRLEDRAALIDKMAYVFANPVEAGLVETVAEWPGAHGFEALLTGKPIRATRPKHFFSEHGCMPEEVELSVGIPAALGDEDEIREAVAARVTEIEQAEAANRKRTGKSVVGRYKVLRQSWQDSPTSYREKRGLRPTYATRNFWARVEAAQRKREFEFAYRIARRALLAGAPVPFPPGTYWLARFVGVSVAGRAANSVVAQTSSENLN